MGGRGAGGQSGIIEAFTELAPQYEDTVDRELRQFWGVSYEALVGQLIEAASVTEGNAVLDVATGTAFIPLRLADNVGGRGRVVGLDITLAMLEHGRRSAQAAGLSSRISLVCASAMAMPFVEGVFDAVICGLGTHHMDVPQMLSEMRRVLKPKGTLVVADVGTSAFWQSFGGTVLLKLLLAVYRLSRMGAVRAQAENEALSNIYAASEWHAMLSDAGFAEIQIVESRARRPWYPHALTMKAVAGGRTL